MVLKLLLAFSALKIILLANFYTPLGVLYRVRFIGVTVSARGTGAGVPLAIGIFFRNAAKNLGMILRHTPLRGS